MIIGNINKSNNFYKPCQPGKNNVQKNDNNLENNITNNVAFYKIAFGLQNKSLPKIRSFDPAKLHTDAETFQYKNNSDVNGVTERLKTVKEWDPVFAGTVIVYERKDGTQYIADGHQRLALAKRLNDKRIKLYGFLFKETDGYTPKEIRIKAAQKNIAEGSGDAVDAAKIIREVGVEKLPNSIPGNSALVKNGIALSKLGDEAFDKVLKKVVTPQQGAIVAGIIKDDEVKQSACIDELKKHKIKTAEETRWYAREVLNSDLLQRTQVDLFGETVSFDSIVHEKMRIISGTLKSLARKQKLFDELVKREEEIEAVGENRLGTRANIGESRDLETAIDRMESNSLDKEANKKRKKNLRRAADFIRKQYNVKGELSSKANELALRLKREEITYEEAVSELEKFVLG